MKLKNLKIVFFRGFNAFALQNLGRVNLLVGTNNSGKTTILEAAELVTSNNKLLSIWSILARRGEILPSENQSILNNSSERSVEVCRLFRNHNITLGSWIGISAETESNTLEFRANGNPLASRNDNLSNFDLLGDGDAFSDQHEDLMTLFTLSLRWKHSSRQLSAHETEVLDVPLGINGGLSLRAARKYTEASPQDINRIPVQFVSASSLTSNAIASLYSEVVLTQKEDMVVEALRIIEPNIERIAAVESKHGRSGFASRGGILVRVAGLSDRTPIASMGDGIWRILGLALAVVHSQNGLLLIDEVDTGLHHSVMGKMWRFLNDCSQKFNVQIIASTHSRDCYQSLAAICREDVIDQSEVTIQRIEPGRSEAVAYSEAAIIAAAERDLEVR